MVLESSIYVIKIDLDQYLVHQVYLLSALLLLTFVLTGSCRLSEELVVETGPGKL